MRSWRDSRSPPCSGTKAAEDLVQDTIEAALRNAESFSGQSSLKTWLFGILKHKTMDHIRRGGRMVCASSMVRDDDEWQEQVESLFNGRGHWSPGSRPSPWPEPEQSIGDKQFWRVFEGCLEHLPGKAARVFMMREILLRGAGVWPKLFSVRSETGKTAWRLRHSRRAAGALSNSRASHDPSVC